VQQVAIVMPNHPQPQRLASAQGAYPKLVKLEREVSSFVERIRTRTRRPRRPPGKRTAIARLSGAAEETLAAFSATLQASFFAVAASARKLARIAIHGGSPVRVRRQSPTQPTTKTATASAAPHGSAGFGYLAVSAGIGLLIVCGTLILAMFLEMRDLKKEVGHLSTELAVTKMRLDQTEKAAERTIKEQAARAQAPHPPMVISDADSKIVRQFIRVLPPPPGAQQKIHVGDAISNLTLAPVPDSLVGQLPKLRGARFTIDDDSSIALAGEGSNQVDAVLSYR
jgi:hypothetical protein